MTALGFLVWALTVHGVTYIVTQSSLFDPVRRLVSRTRFGAALIVCPLCFGTWVGMLLSVLGFAPVRLLTTELALGPFRGWPWWLCILFDGGLASGLAWFLHLTAHRMNAPAPSRAPAAALPPPPQTVYVQHLGLPGSEPPETVDIEPMAAPRQA